MLENIKLAFQGIWGHKMRSLLTMLGIIIGIASIISIVSTIKGTNEQIKQNLVGSGTNLVTVALYQGDYEYELGWGEVPEGVPYHSDAIRSQVAALAVVEDASFFQKRTYVDNVYYQNTAFNGKMLGVDLHYLNTNCLQVNVGRGFSEADFRDNKKVCLLDQTAAQSLFANKDAVGEVLEIDKEPFVIIGVYSAKNSSEPVIENMNDYYLYVGDNSGTVLIPTTQWGVIYRYDEPQNLCLKATSTDDMTSAGQKAAEIMNRTLCLPVDSDYSYRSNDISQQAQQLQSLSSTTNMQLLWIASISLLVGGIGVMNIMLVSVTERTREIGLKKAIGARENRILWQFLTEAAVLTSFGGVAGVVCGIVLAKVISTLTGAPMAVSVPSVLLAVAFSTLIGVVFGLLPAVKASRLNPIDALRRE